MEKIAKEIKEIYRINGQCEEKKKIIETITRKENNGIITERKQIEECKDVGFIEQYGSFIILVLIFDIVGILGIYALSKRISKSFGNIINLNI